MVARTLASNVRSFDLVCRWGGDEFLILLTNLTDSHFFDRCESLRALVEQSVLPLSGSSLSVTISVGATLAETDDTSDTLVGRADSALLKGKRRGRNTVWIA
jgi:diguanylate cyclase (GGDEF)-like protein